MAEGNCIVCGSPTRTFKSSGLYRIYCSRECLDSSSISRDRYRKKRATGWKPLRRPYVSKRKPPANACVICGAIAKKLYCSRACAEKAKYRRAVARGIPKCQRKKRGPFVCQGCGKSYFSTRQKGEGEKFCTRACAFKAKTLSKVAPSSAVWFRSCIVCSKAFSAKRINVRFCSLVCQNSYQQPKCNICGAFKQRGAWLRTCDSQACVDAYVIQQRDKKRELRSNSKRLRRARMKTDKATLVFRIRVFDACNWKCCSCGCDAPRSLMGTMGDNAPELDHRIALANGGTHDMSNCQLLCRVCNHFKSDRSPSEWERWKCRGQESQLQN